MAGLFQVLWGQSDGGFKQAAILNGTDNEPLIISIQRRGQPLRTPLKPGDNGQLVADLQRILNARLKPTPSLLADGDFGPKTKTEVLKFQRLNKLPATGTVDMATWKALGTLVTEGKYLTEKICTRPTAVDWDADGDLDLILSGEEIVSMNMWGFTPELFNYLEEGFIQFLGSKGDELKSEYLIPTIINTFLN